MTGDFFGAALLRFELLRSGADRRIHHARWGILYLFAMLLSLIWVAVEGEDMSRRIIPYLFMAGSWSVLILLLLSGLYLIAMSFAEERDLGAFPVLLSTPMTAFGICFAKWASVMIRSTLILLVMMPFVSLLFVEGGLATEQVSATLLLGLFMLGLGAAVAVLSATMYREAGAGIVQSVAVMGLSYVAYVLAEAVPGLLGAGTLRNHLVSWRVFGLVVQGDPSVMGGALPSILLVQGLLHATGAVLLLGLSSRILRFMEQTGAASLWRAVRRNRQVTETSAPLPDGVPAEPGSVAFPPWRWQSAPVAWRGLSVRADRFRWSWHPLPLLILMFLPQAFVLVVSSIQYVVSAVGVRLGEGVWPGVPEGFPWAWGTRAYYDAVTMRMAHDVGSASWHFAIPAERVLQYGSGWVLMISSCLLLTFMVMWPIQMATAVPRERAGKRLAPLLVTTLRDSSLFDGIVYHALSRWRSVAPALVAALVYAAFDPRLPILTMFFIFVLFLVSAYFWGNLGMYAGLTSMTVRSALVRLVTYVVLIWVLPPIGGLLLAHSLSLREILLLLLVLSLSNPLLILWFHPGFGFFWHPLRHAALMDIGEGHVLFSILYFLVPVGLAYGGRRVHVPCRGDFRRYLQLDETRKIILMWRILRQRSQS